MQSWIWHDNLDPLRFTWPSVYGKKHENSGKTLVVLLRPHKDGFQSKFHYIADSLLKLLQNS